MKNLLLLLLLSIFSFINTSCNTEIKPTTNYKLQISCEEPLNYLKVFILNGSTVVNSFKVINKSSLTVYITEGNSFVIATRKANNFNYNYKLLNTTNSIVKYGKEYCNNYSVVHVNYKELRN